MIEKLMCAVFGHKYVVLRVLNLGARKVGCTRCEKQWGMHDSTRAFVPWDGDLEAMYAPGWPLEPAIDPRSFGLPAYPVGDVVGACVCGSWPGGKCLRCPVIAGEAVNGGRL